MRNLNQHPGAIPRFRIASASAAVGQVDEDLNALEDNVMALLASNVGHEPHATSVMLIARVDRGPGREEVRAR